MKMMLRGYDETLQRLLQSVSQRDPASGWRIVALDVGLDSTTPAGELVAALAMAARFEYRRIQERQVEKHDALRRQGRPRGRAAVDRDLADRIIAMRQEGFTRSMRSPAGSTGRVYRPPAVGSAWRASSARSAAATRARELVANEKVAGEVTGRPDRSPIRSVILRAARARNVLGVLDSLRGEGQCGCTSVSAVSPWLARSHRGIGT